MATNRPTSVDLAAKAIPVALSAQFLHIDIAETAHGNGAAGVIHIAEYLPKTDIYDILPSLARLAKPDPSRHYVDTVCFPAYVSSNAVKHIIAVIIAMLDCENSRADYPTMHHEPTLMQKLEVFVAMKHMGAAGTAHYQDVEDWIVAKIPSVVMNKKIVHFTATWLEGDSPVYKAVMNTLLRQDIVRYLGGENSKELHDYLMKENRTLGNLYYAKKIAFERAIKRGEAEISMNRIDIHWEFHPPYLEQKEKNIEKAFKKAMEVVALEAEKLIDQHAEAQRLQGRLAQGAWSKKLMFEV